MKHIQNQQQAETCSVLQSVEVLRKTSAAAAAAATMTTTTTTMAAAKAKQRRNPLYSPLQIEAPMDRT